MRPSIDVWLFEELNTNVFSSLSEITSHLFLTALIAGVLGFIVVSRILSKPASVLVITIKVGLIFWYFGVEPANLWHVWGDDEKYLEKGLRLFQSGVDPFRILFAVEGDSILRQMSNMAMLSWVVMLSFWIFGEHYYSVIFILMLVTCLSALFADGIQKNLGHGRRYRRYFAVFFLLHWEVLAWSSFAIWKEPLIVLCTFAFIYGVSIIDRSFFSKSAWIFGGFWALAALFVFEYVRFYFPVLLGAALVMAWISKYARLSSIIVLLVLGVLVGWGLHGYLNLILEVVEIEKIFYGLVRMMLSPLPWQISPEMSYLLLPTIMNWFMLPVTVLGCGVFWIRSSVTSRLLVIFFWVGIIFYSFIPVIQDPRHRAPLFIIAVFFQYEVIHRVVSIIYKATKNTKDSDGALQSRSSHSGNVDR